ncbi:unnamed protein product [Adineta ricciae]|uniref:Uncharacterized protein n=2 Tax=Adineta ricciae TaxID=249248 RepID=A0A815CU63_ADIRI|nr:unnamed protein product [Adineta ricciae]
MQVVNSTKSSSQSRSPSTGLIGNNDRNDSQANIAFLQQKRKSNVDVSSKRVSSVSNIERLPPNLLEMKQQRLVAAAARKKRLITRIITVIGLLMILLCAGIVALTLKMAPKIDELVRTKAGPHPSVHLQSRFTTLSSNLHNSSTNSSLK